MTEFIVVLLLRSSWPDCTETERSVVLIGAPYELYVDAEFDNCQLLWARVGLSWLNKRFGRGRGSRYVYRLG